MRLIDADALEELFREVIGGIAKRPEINGNLEHMIRASAMVVEMIKDAPTIEPQPRWIPCSVRLPDESNFYMVTNEYDEVEIIWFSHKDDYDIDKSEWRETDDKIIAWMPLPEPYVREGEET